MKTTFISALALAASAFAAPAKDISQINNANLLTELFPNYLVPINEAQPNQAYGTQFTADIAFTHHGNETRMFVGFDVPNNGATSCSVALVLPPPQAGEQNPWTVTGTGKLDVSVSPYVLDLRYDLTFPRCTCRPTMSCQESPPGTPSLRGLPLPRNFNSRYVQQLRLNIEDRL